MAETPRQETELSFKEWLRLDESARGTSSKTGLYPLGYGGIGLYPIQDYLTHSADAFVYTSMDDRIYKGTEGKPFSITHLKPQPTFTHPSSPLPEPPKSKGTQKPEGIISPRDDRAPGRLKKPTGHGLLGKEVRPRPTPAPGKVVPPKDTKAPQ